MKKVLAIIACGFASAAAVPAFAADEPLQGAGARTEKQWGAGPVSCVF